MDTISAEDPKLAEELTTAQSIFPEELYVTSSCQTHTSLEIRWKDYGVVFEVRLPSSYPLTRPMFLGINRPVATADMETKRIISVFEECLMAAYDPGQRSLVETLQLFRQNQNKGKFVTEKTRQEHVEWTKTFDQRFLQRSLACSMCLGDYPGADMVLLDCQHAFCADCFAGKFRKSRLVLS